MKQTGFIKQSFSTSAKIIRTIDNVVSQAEMATYVSKEEERAELVVSLMSIGWSNADAVKQAGKF